MISIAVGAGGGGLLLVCGVAIGICVGLAVLYRKQIHNSVVRKFTCHDNA